MATLVKLNSIASASLVKVEGIAMAGISKIGGQTYSGGGPAAPGTLSVTIPAADVDATLTNFPMLVILNDTDDAELFAELDDGSLDGLAAAKKLLIRETDSTPMPTEMESCDVPGGQIVLHTLVPSISSSVDTVFYIDYDNEAVDNDAIDIVGTTVGKSVWDANFVVVYHMNNDPTGGVDSILDSTAHENHGDAVGSWTAGMLVDGPSGKALDFPGSGDIWVHLPHNVNQDTMSDELTMSAFIDADVTGNNGVLYRGNFASHSGELNTSLFSDGVGYQVPINNTQGRALGGSPGTDWVNFTGRYDKVNIDILIDGVITGTSDPYTSSVNTFGLDWYFGVYYSNAYEFNGRIGEIRLSDIDRSTAWLDVTSQALHGTLLTVSAPI